MPTATAFSRRAFPGGAVPTTIPAGLSATANSFTIANTTGWPDGTGGYWFAVADEGETTEEKILCASRTGSVVTVATSGRGADGETGEIHANGCPIVCCGTAQDFDEANNVANQVLGQIAASGDLLQGSAANTLQRLALGSRGGILTSGATAAQWLAKGTTGYLLQAGASDPSWVSVASVLAAAWPVGSVFLGASSTSPAALLGFGTWSQIAQGLFLAGVGTGTDKNSATQALAAGADSTLGEFKHLLTAGESGLPAHHHQYYEGNNSSNAAAQSPGYNPFDNNVSTSTGDVAAASASSSHNNVPPYFGLYVWQRTA